MNNDFYKGMAAIGNIMVLLGVLVLCGLCLAIAMS